VKINSILDLHLDDMIGIFGETRYSNALGTRLVVRSLLPRNHGGINAENVLVIDADNSVSPYLYVNIAREYGMHHRNVLHKVLVSRQFTIYQLTNTIIYYLPKRIQLHKFFVYVEIYIYSTEIPPGVSQFSAKLSSGNEVPPTDSAGDLNIVSMADLKEYELRA